MADSSSSPSETFEIPLSKIKLVLLLIGAALLIAGGAWFIRHPNIFHKSTWMVSVAGYVMVVLFSICALFIVNKLFNPSPGFVIDANGVVDNSSVFSVGFIPWIDIIDLSIIEISRQKMIVIKVEDVEGYIKRQPNSLAKKAATANHRLHGSPVIVITATLRITVDELYAKINETWQQNKNYRSRPHFF
jgi:hypothetical protein